jgi:sugar O-acyltransferase (sialic acid O-acetyltransferase NeuD family)
MNEFNILGNAKNYIPVIFDLIEDIFGKSIFNIYHNLSLIEKPDFIFDANYYNFNLIDNWQSFDKQLDNCVFGVNGPKAKEIVFNNFKNIFKSNYLSLIHPHSYISRSAKLSTGIIIEPNCTVSSQTQIDFGVNIKRNSSIGHHVLINEFCEINPGVTISSNVVIGKKTILGSGSVIKNRITIGENSLIGVGSVVTKNIPDGVIAFGNPCKVVRENG